MEKKFDSFSPTDYRYSVEDLKPYLTENSFVKYKARVEAALVKVLAKYAMVTSEIAQEIIQATRAIKPEEVYQEEKRIKHDIRALVNCIRNKVSDQAKPYVHLLATSCDIVDTANVLRYKDAANKVILPEMIKLEKEWIALALREKKTLQIGRTHGQHAEPITFGFALSQYVHRWGGRILYLKEAADNLVGKFSGAVGAYNSSSLFFAHPEKFEKEILQELGLCPALISTQIIPPEPTADFAHALVSAFGVLANFCDDFRHLQRTEIAEVGERFGGEQVGSSTMPQKRNPINFENVKSMWKAFMPRMVTVYSDQISEHQRDLTNSCSQRYFPELLVAFCSSVKRVSRISGNLRVNKKKMEENFKISEKTLIAEPLYILLASFGHPDAHEYVRKLTMECERTGKSLSELAREDKNLQVYLKKLTAAQQEIILNPSKYIGAASSKTEKVVSFWKKRIKKAKL
ncbi:MAG: adenylosuccinate lyase [bacterium (Candidatus Ratteibacteria) CG_4_9_14_3_um_filter_41_21]|uniref:Adenylosuccinate lyase n=1 Tax=bacterium (Candidatus Ratteibacteria) CG_4_9_14_3_um_filter_41_21 TaxID=2014289 RepID=A0A2M7YEP8_9BACT|nr:MAG: adenylosuccinate lyase [bacterium (Candidatus Ratteibacteria) CG_4_9_14_3_um_filter_41_21]